MARGIEFQKSTFLTFYAIGFCIILIIGIICGFAGRAPANCDISKPEQPTTTTSKTTPTISSTKTSTEAIIIYKVYLDSLATLTSTSKGFLPGTKVDVTALETLVNNNQLFKLN